MSAQLSTSCLKQQLPTAINFLSCAPRALRQRSQHKHSSFLAFRRPAHVRSMFFILVVRDLPSSAQDLLMDPVGKGSMYFVTRAVPEILLIHSS